MGEDHLHRYEEHAARQLQEALEVAREAAAQTPWRETKETRAQQLSAHYYNNRGDGLAEAAHEKLTKAGVPNRTPAPGLAPVPR